MNSIHQNKVECIEIHLKAVRAALFEGCGLDELDYNLLRIKECVEFIQNRNKTRIKISCNT